MMMEFVKCQITSTP